MICEIPRLDSFIQQRLLSVCYELLTVVRVAAGNGTDKSLTVGIAWRRRASEFNEEKRHVWWVRPQRGCSEAG